MACYRHVGSVYLYGCEGWTVDQGMARDIKAWNWQRLRTMLRLRHRPDEGHQAYNIRTSKWLTQLHVTLRLDDLLTQALMRYHAFALRAAEAPPSWGEAPVTNGDVLAIREGLAEGERGAQGPWRS